MGLLSGLLPKPKGIPANITPHTNVFQDIGGSIMRNLPYGGGLAYDALGTIWHLINGTIGQHGVAPTVPGRLAQYAFPNIGQPSGLQLPINSQTNNPPMYGPAQGPVQPTAAGVPMPPSTAGLGPGGIPSSVWQNVFNTGRFTNAPPGFPTLAQAQFPGSMIGPSGGIQNPFNPNAPSVTGKSGSDSGLFGSTQAWWNNVLGGRQI